MLWAFSIHTLNSDLPWWPGLGESWSEHRKSGLCRLCSSVLCCVPGSEPREVVDTCSSGDPLLPAPASCLALGGTVEDLAGWFLSACVSQVLGQTVAGCFPAGPSWCTGAWDPLCVAHLQSEGSACPVPEHRVLPGCLPLRFCCQEPGQNAQLEGSGPSWLCWLQRSLWGV